MRWAGEGRQPRRLERLSSLDASTLRAEDRGLPIHVAVLSCAWPLNFTIAGDPVAVPDLAVFARGTSGALSQLDALPVRTFGPV